MAAAGWLGIVAAVFPGCRVRDKKHAGRTTDLLYFDYRILAEEGKDNVTVLLQFRNTENGDAVSIRGAGTVTLDDEPVPGDSSRLTGFYYELHKPLDSFAGPHVLRFSGANGKVYREDFDFQPMRLQTELPETLNRKERMLQLEGLQPREAVRVLLTDTSFINNGVNYLDTVQEGRCSIGAGVFGELANGPVQLELIREYERPLKQATEKGGRLQITYSLKRDFRLEGD